MYRVWKNLAAMKVFQRFHYREIPSTECVRAYAVYRVRVNARRKHREMACECEWIVSVGEYLTLANLIEKRLIAINEDKFSLTAETIQIHSIPFNSLQYAAVGRNERTRYGHLNVEQSQPAMIMFIQSLVD